MRLSTALLFATLAVAGCASAPPLAVPTATREGILVNPQGLTLYIYDRDVPDSGVSACVTQCAVEWPPFLVAKGGTPPADYSVIQRVDGRAQWAFRGQPLYTWPEDQEPGERYGDDYQKVWHIVKPGKPRVVRTPPPSDNDGY